MFWHNDIRYTDFENGTVMVGTGENSGTTPNALSSKQSAPTNLVIPPYIDSKQVITIGRNSFSSCLNLETVTIPSTVLLKQKYLFECCNNIF